MNGIPGRRAHLWLGGCLLASVSCMPACDDLPAAKSAAVTLLEPGGPPTIIYVLCDDQKIDHVQLIRKAGDSPYDGDDEILWQISGDPRTREETIVVGGDPPPGLEEDVPLDSEASEHERLVVAVRADGIRFGISFRESELAVGRALNLDGNKSMTEFREQAACG